MFACALVTLFYVIIMIQPRIIVFHRDYELYVIGIMCTFGCTSQVTARVTNIVAMATNLLTMIDGWWLLLATIKSYRITDVNQTY